MDQSKNINPKTGQRSNINLDVNTNFSSSSDITINSITDDTITFTTDAAILSSTFLSYLLIDECNGLSAQATVSSWCHNTTPIFAPKIIDLYTKTLYTFNVVTGAFTTSTGKGIITTTGNDRDSTYITPGGVSLVGNIFILPGSVSITGDATIAGTTSDTIIIQTNNSFTSNSISLNYSLVNECGVIQNQTFIGTMTPYLPENYIRDLQYHGEETKTLSMSVTVDSSYMNGYSFAIVGGGTTYNNCRAGSSTCSLQTTIGGSTSTSNAIIYRCFIFRNSKLYYRASSDATITSFLEANYDVTGETGYKPIPDTSFWNDLLDITSGYTEITSASLSDTVVSVKSGNCYGGMSGYLTAIRYI